MRKSSLLLIIFVLFLSQFGGLPARAATEIEGGFEYEVNGDGSTVTITGYTSGAPKDVVIPNMLGGMDVTVIGDSAFSRSDLTSVDIPLSVTTIGYMAFGENNLQGGVTIPASVITIGNYAFYSSNLLSVTIPDSVTTIGDFAFIYNNLKVVNIPESVTVIGKKAFSGSKLTEVTISNDSTVIGDDAFNSSDWGDVGNFTLYGYNEDSTAKKYADNKGLTFKLLDKNVTYEGNDQTSGDVPSDNRTYGEGQEFTVLGNVGSLLKAGYTFGGWNTSDDGNGTDYAVKSTFSMGEEGVTLHARWDPIVTTDHTLSFDPNGGLGGVVEQEVVDGGNATELNPPPTKDEYTFVGWYKDAGTLEDEWDFGVETVTEPTTLYAKWTPFTYTENPDGVSVTITGYASTALKDVDIPATLGGKSVTVIGDRAFTARGLTHVTIPTSVTSIGDGTITESGWRGNGAFSENKLTEIIIPSSVTTIGDDAFKYNRFREITIPDSVTTIGGFAFTDNPIQEIAIPASVTIIGSFAFADNDLEKVVFEGTPTIETIEGMAFALNDLTEVTIPASVKTIGGWAFHDNKLNKVEFEGPLTAIEDGAFSFQGEPVTWYINQKLTQLWLEDAVSKPMTVYTIYKHEVTFDSNGGTMVANQQVSEGETVTKPANPARSGHTFAGWYNEADFTTKWNFGAGVIDDMTLYAKWTKNSGGGGTIPTYTLTFDANGGSDVATQKITRNEKAVNPTAPTRTGYTFEGWYKESGFTNEWNFVTDVMKENTTVYAKWTTNSSGGGSGGYYSYTLTFNTNEGSTVASQSLGYNEKAVNPVPPTKAGSTFAGWYKEATFTNEWNFTKDVVKENTVLYAKWTPASYTFTFNTNEGSTVASQTLGYNEKAVNPTVPTKANHTFAGWYKDTTFTNEWNFTTDAVKENTILYAKWTTNLPLCTANFTDIASHWAKYEIDDTACHGVIKGYPDGTFRPNESITREHVAVMLTRVFELTPLRSEISFTDVPTNHRYYDAITQAYQAGIFDGASNKKFNPNAQMTRAQMAKVLVLAFELESSETKINTSIFQDVPSTHWAKDYIAMLSDYGIALGDNGNFKPEKPVTRAQFVAFMHRALN